jgi:hypothetical protein
MPVWVWNRKYTRLDDNVRKEIGRRGVYLPLEDEYLQNR